MRLGIQQKKILTTLQAYPSLTILEVANKIHGRNVTVGGKEYNSIAEAYTFLKQADTWKNRLVKSDGS